MIEIKNWMKHFLQALDAHFGERAWFVGLQGSYGRGEATEESDIDVVGILDNLSAADLRQYRAMLDTLPHRELICGFLAGKEELLHWDAADLFQFCYDTTPIQGSLDELMSLLDDAAVWRAIKTGVCNLYHGCVHNMLHERSEDVLRGLYTSASFAVQAICFAQTGTYIRHQKELREKISPQEREILDMFSALKCGESVAFDEMSERLFSWAGIWIKAG